MAARRVRPPQPLAPHGLPGHLVEFVEALRAQGISVGPSETVDAGRVMSVLGLGDREVLREGIACAVLRRPDHRDTYDAMFDLWFPAALGARTVLPDDGLDDDAERDEHGLPPEDVEAMRAALLDLLSDNEDLANLDERLAAMIAQIVEAYGRYNSSRGPSYSSYQALKAMNLDDLEGRLLAGLLAPYGDEPTPTQEQIAKAIAAQRISQLRKMVEGETKRRTAEQLGRDHVQMYGVPQLAENVEFLRASGEQLCQMRRVVAPLARTLATRLAARRRRSRAGEIDLRKTLRKSMSTGGVPIDVVLKKPHPARPELVVLCDVSGSVAGFSHFTLLLVHALRQQFSRVRVFAFIDTTDEVTELFGPDADLAVAVQRITREAGVYTRDGHSDYGNAFVSFLEKWPNVLSPRSSLLVLGDGRNNYRNPETELLAHMVNASRHAHWLNPEPRHLWGSGDSAVPRYQEVITMHECRSAKQLATVIDQLLPV
ncbi:vWA domain-containing protein [Mycobacterium hubeiense]|uniref:vWA domain-containing protein n=1 Tax=Mycobacterium hubeiense TaxID=1867256 RepID=UPI000C7F1A3D|nr:VWA domain-containing protein [Mycobacterium sp. QGD 101]